MSKKKIFLSVGILVLLLLGVLLFLRIRVHELPASALPMDTTAVVPENSESGPPGDIPYALTGWIERSLWKSGLWAMRDSFLAMDSGKRTRLRKDTTGHATAPVWVVDFSNLPVSDLDADDELTTDDYEVAVRLQGTRICSTKEIPEWIRTRATGIGHGSCSGGDDFALATTWFQHNFNRAPSQTEISGPANRGPTAIRVRCEKGGSLLELGLLASLAPDTLEIDRCRLGSSEQLALQQIHAGRLVLRDLPDTVLDLDPSRVVREISVEGGEVQWLDLPTSCPEDSEKCSKVHLRQGLTVSVSQAPICQPDLQHDLVQYGVVLSQPKCQDYPTTLLDLRRSMVAEWDTLVGTEIPSESWLPGADSLRQDSLPEMPTSDTVRREAQGISNWGEGEPVYPNGFDIDYAQYGRDWIQDNQGSFSTGDALRTKFKGRPLQAGMTREQVIQVVGKPAINRGDFLGWIADRGCEDTDYSVSLRAHFDAKGLLDGWFLDPMDVCGD